MTALGRLETVALQHESVRCAFEAVILVVCDEGPDLLRVVRYLPTTTGISVTHRLNGQVSDKPRGRKPREQ